MTFSTSLSIILNLGILGAGTFIGLTNKNYDGLGLIAAGLFNLSYILVNEVNTLAKIHTDSVENAYLDAGGEYAEQEEGEEEYEVEEECEEEEEEEGDTDEYVGSEEGEVVEEDDGYARTFDSENNLVHLTSTCPPPCDCPPPPCDCPPPPCDSNCECDCDAVDDMPALEGMSSVVEPVTEPVAEPVVASVLPPPQLPPPPFVTTLPPPPPPRPAAPRKVKRDDTSFEI